MELKVLGSAISLHLLRRRTNLIHRRHKQLCILLYVLALCLFGMAKVQAAQVKVSVAKSFADTGVLQALIRKFTNAHPDIAIKIQAVGSLQALNHARQQQADMVITHYPLEEKRLVEQGFASQRTQLIGSKLAVFGPSKDEFRLKLKPSITNVLKTLYDNEADFISPSPRGGTHAKIEELWTLTGIHPGWIGYEYSQVSSLGAMMQAAESDGYTIADLGTYLSNKDKFPSTFIPLYQNDLALQNTYSVLVVKQHIQPAEKFYHYLVSDEGQNDIQNIAQQIYNAAIITPIAHFDPEFLAAQNNKKLRQQNKYLLIGFGLLLAVFLLLTFAIYQNKRVQKLVKQEYENEKERFRLERELQQAHKMESLGQLSGGIAHDFNNLLCIILGFTGMAQTLSHNDKNTKLQRYLEQIKKSGDRAKNLVAQMLQFSRNEKVETQALHIEEILNEDIEMLRAVLTSCIILDLNIHKNIPPVLLNKNQLEQILMNLSINARDAMNGSGTLSISLKFQKEMNAVCSLSHKPIKGDWIVLSISDTGSGITKDIRNKIFDPFFTTKETGKGTGMGLSVVYGIMVEHGGAIIVDSELDKGTTFYMLFPPYIEEAQQKSIG